jgi:DNA-binding transcriptional LysR family regulator
VEFRQLTYFIAVAEEAHFRRAARRVAISQPALSHQIAHLEAELGVQLFDRSRRHVELTKAGQVFLRAAKKLLADLDGAVERARQAGASQRRLYLGYPEYIGSEYIGPALRRLSEAAPEVEVETRDVPYEEAVNRVLAGRLDVGLTFAPVTDAELASRPVMHGRWTVVMPQDHALATLGEVPLALLASERFVFFERSQNPRVYDLFVQLCREAGFVPRIVYHTAQARNGPALVANGLGVFVAGSYVLEDCVPPKVVTRPLTGFDNRIVICLAWRADNRSFALRAFLDAAKIANRPFDTAATAAGRQAPTLRT